MNMYVGDAIFLEGVIIILLMTTHLVRHWHRR
jgi:hypothetical protein